MAGCNLQGDSRNDCELSVVVEGLEMLLLLQQQLIQLIQLSGLASQDSRTQKNLSDSVLGHAISS